MWEFLGEIFGEILLFVAIAIIIGLCWLAKGLWDGLLKWIMRSAFGEWYRGEPWIWRATVSIAGVISLFLLFWCLWGHRILVFIRAHDGIGVSEISILVSLVIFGFLILGACWNISEGLERSGLDKRIVKYGFPLVAFGTLILFAITISAFGILMLRLTTITAGIAIGTIFLITVFFFTRSRARAKAWELEDQLKGLEEQLSLHHITQEEYEQRKKELLASAPEN